MSNINSYAQSSKPTTNLWLGSYASMRIDKKLFWDGEFHFRRSEHNNIPLIGKMGQIYNRHSLTYKFSDDFLLTAGGVLRLDFTPQPGDNNYKTLILEPRLWHQYLFPTKTYILGRQFVISHRIRIEHRWSTRHLKTDNNWIFRNRWRYAIVTKLPLNRKTFQPKTWYLTPINVELIMQNGKNVGGANLEDLRIYPAIGYIVNTKLAYSAGLCYTTGQNLNDATNYRQRWLFRLNIYWTPDFRRFEEKIPTINIID